MKACMQDTFARARARPKSQARDDRASCIQNESTRPKSSGDIANTSFLSPSDKLHIALFVEIALATRIIVCEY